MMRQCPTAKRPSPWLAALITAASLTGLSGCEADAPPATIDAPWFRESAVAHHLSPLLAAAPTPSGALNAKFSRTWTPLPKQRYSPTTQGRVLFALASGHDLTGMPAYRFELRRGADFLLAHMLDRENGGVYDAVDADGKVLSTDKRLYGQAFALFGLAHAYRVTRDERYIGAATFIWERVHVLMRDKSGGLVVSTDRLFTKLSNARNQNPIMHLFEALLALYDATADKRWLREARELGDFVLTRLVQKTAEDRRAIPELYDVNWRPQSSDKGGYIDLGHQVEWAWLLSAAAERGLPAYYIDIGAKLLDFAVATGYDRDRGGLFWRVDDKGRVSRDKIWWIQSEFLRATLRYSIKHDRADLRRLFEQTLGYVKSEFVDAEHGGWTARPRSQCQGRACPSEQPDAGYHIVALHMEALALAGARPPTQ